MKVSSETRQGTERRNNEDYAVYGRLPHGGCLMILADGMGGKDMGELAAKTIAETILAHIENMYERSTEKDCLLGALEAADKALCEVNIKERSKLGATVAILLIKQNRIFYTWQGNVRAYLNHRGEWLQLTSDHVLSIGYGKYKVCRSIKGEGLRDDVPFEETEIASSDTVMLCTDGFYKIATDNLPSPDDLPQTFKIIVNEDDATYILATPDK